MHYQRGLRHGTITVDERPKIPMVDRIMAKVVHSGDCWLYTGSDNGKGYGITSDDRRRPRYVHRVMYEHAVGPIPPGVEVCHTCDVRNCVRPDHLFLGTHRQNIEDCVSKGRHARGEKTAGRKLTEAAVRDIRLRAAAGEQHQALGAEYGVDRRTIGGIVRRQHWRHVA